jgi:hypothetical protein
MDFEAEGREMHVAVKRAIALVNATLEPVHPITDRAIFAPNFEMLHYLVTGVLRKTGFAVGLFDDAELERFGVPTPQQGEFIDRIHAVLAICVGESLGARVRLWQADDATHE